MCWKAAALSAKAQEPALRENIHDLFMGGQGLWLEWFVANPLADSGHQPIFAPVTARPASGSFRSIARFL